MTTRNTTETILSEQTIDYLQKIRRANWAIGACANLLYKDGANEGSDEGSEPVFVKIPPDVAGGLVCAIEVCSTQIADILEEQFQESGVQYQQSYGEYFEEQRNAEAEILGIVPRAGGAS